MLELRKCDLSFRCLKTICICMFVVACKFAVYNSEPHIRNLCVTCGFWCLSARSRWRAIWHSAFLNLFAFPMSAAMQSSACSRTRFAQHEHINRNIGPCACCVWMCCSNGQCPVLLVILRSRIASIPLTADAACFFVPIGFDTC